MTTRTQIEFVDGTAWIAIDDGKANVMTREMLDEISARLDEASDSAVTVLAGRKGIFSAGFDLKTFQRGPAESREMVGSGVRLIQRMLGHPRPIIAACTGHAYPMGAFLMLCADVRFGVTGSSSIGMNEVAIAITVPHFAIALARHRLTPSGFAHITHGKMFRPDAAVAMGYLDYVVDEGELRDAVMAEAKRLRELHLPSYVATKERINAPVIRAIGEAWANAGLS